MKREINLSYDDLVATLNALASWIDAFEAEEPDDAVRVRKAMQAIEQTIELMDHDRAMVLGLVKPKTEIH